MGRSGKLNNSWDLSNCGILKPSQSYPSAIENILITLRWFDDEMMRLFDQNYRIPHNQTVQPTLFTKHSSNSIRIRHRLEVVEVEETSYTRNFAKITQKKFSQQIFHVQLYKRRCTCSLEPSQKSRKDEEQVFLFIFLINPFKLNAKSCSLFKWTHVNCSCKVHSSKVAVAKVINELIIASLL